MTLPGRKRVGRAGETRIVSGEKGKVCCEALLWAFQNLVKWDECSQRSKMAKELVIIKMMLLCKCGRIQS